MATVFLSSFGVELLAWPAGDETQVVTLEKTIMIPQDVRIADLVLGLRRLLEHLQPGAVGMLALLLVPLLVIAVANLPKEKRVLAGLSNIGWVLFLLLVALLISGCVPGDPGVGSWTVGPLQGKRWCQWVQSEDGSYVPVLFGTPGPERMDTDPNHRWNIENVCPSPPSQSQ